MSYFVDRHDAGLQLADMLKRYVNAKNTLILALPRGGVPIAATMASVLNLPFDILLVRKLGHPYHPEFAFGAISVNDVIILNSPYCFDDVIGQPSFNQVLMNEKAELERRNQYYRQNKPWPDLTNKTIILVDDGIATGATMKAAIAAVKKLGSRRVVVAIPVMPVDELNDFKNIVDELYVVHTPSDFRAVGCWYQYFDQVSDDEVISILS
ncbi:phosphoribosyltransferase [Legionella sp. W05-934-2]|jgi:predicted phosphoribosyltransferase|uniref:phosphoribosyltransferase n=1 Tax=Legionella sp. W05-934-2 TaxID=1198649 RepID=UPI003462BA01